jgi:hypothetical protein
MFYFYKGVLLHLRESSLELTLIDIVKTRQELIGKPSDNWSSSSSLVRFDLKKNKFLGEPPMSESELAYLLENRNHQNKGFFVTLRKGIYLIVFRFLIDIFQPCLVVHWTVSIEFF